MSCDQVPYLARVCFSCIPCWFGTPSPSPPGSVTSSLRRPAPHDSSQAPSSKRLASSHGCWYCTVTSCPDHCPLSSRGWASYGAMKGPTWRMEFAGSATASFLLGSAGGVPRVGLLSSSLILNLARVVPFPMIFLLLIRFSFLGFPYANLSPLGSGIFGVVASMPPSRESLAIGTLGLGWIFRLSRLWFSLTFQEWYQSHAKVH